MLTQWESVTKKYAQAFIHVYSNQLTEETVTQVSSCASFLVLHKNINAYLTLSTISNKAKHALLEEIFAHFQLPITFNKLSSTLLEKRCIDLLGNILQKIVTEYNRQKNVVTFTISTSHQIEETMKKSLINFLQKKVSPNIYFDFTIDPSLICGVKIKSKTLLWERSIAKQLKTIELDALQRVQL